jgi:hypothetical protein
MGDGQSTGQRAHAASWLGFPKTAVSANDDKRPHAVNAHRESLIINGIEYGLVKATMV